jgi:MFS family permease
MPSDQGRPSRPAVPLYRNRDFVLLQTGQLLSDVGREVTLLAYPLLVLAITGSPAKAGIVAFARLLAATVWALPAGLAADRWNRKRLMIAADAVRVLLVGGLAVALVLDVASFWMIAAISFAEGGAGALFFAAYAGAMRSVVPALQLPAAAGAQTGRLAAVKLAGPPLGGVLLGLGRSLPFIVDAVSYAFSMLSLMLMRTPFQRERPADRTPVRARLTAGMRFLWDHPFLRASTLMFGLANFIAAGMPLAVIVLAERDGLSGGQIGLLVAASGVCLLVGSALSPLVLRVLPSHAVLLLEFWTWAGSAAYLVWPKLPVVVASFLLTMLVIPSTDSVVHGFRLALTPDHLIARVESAARTIGLVIAPLGPFVAGLLLDSAPARVAIGVFAVTGLILAVSATLSPAIRGAPRIADLGELSVVR